MIWKVALPGSGNSSPVLVGDLILLTAEEETASRPGHAQVDISIMAFDAQTGTARWNQSAGQGHGPTHSKAGYSSATIAASRDHGFAFFGEAGLVCFELESGTPLWRQEFSGNRHEWGIVSSPVLFRDMVIQLVDGEQGESFLAAFEQSTGTLVWKVARASHGCWTTPILLHEDLPNSGISDGAFSSSSGEPTRSESREATPETNRRPQLIVNGTGHKDGTAGWVISYDPLTGDELWRARGTSDIPVPTALTWNDHIISASGGNGPVFAIRSDGHGDVTATHLLWKLPTGGPYVPSGLVMEDRLYLLMDGGALVCREAASGELISRQRLSGTYTASLVGAEDYIYAVNEAGDFHILESSPELRIVSSLSLHEQCLATPAIVDGHIYLRTAQHLYCLGTTSLARKDLDTPTAVALPTRPATFLPEASSSPKASTEFPSVSDEVRCL